MIIRELVLHNFGVYASTNKFEFQGKKPIVLIGGMNGRGKTTFLEAVLLALYGSNSFAYSESKYKTFGQYLKSFINVSDGTLETFIDLEFSIDSSRSEIYRIHREWSGDKKRIAEHISVYKDQEYNQFLTDNWMMFIENILQVDVQISFSLMEKKLQSLQLKNQQSNERIYKSLLGISVLDLLQSDLGRIINRTTKNQVSNVEAKEIELLRSQRDKAKENFEKIESELKGLNDKKEELQQELESARQDYVTNGGDIVAQRQELFQNRATMSSKIEALKEQLVLDAASELPFVLVKRLLRNIRENAEIEQDNKMLEVALDKMKKYSAGVQSQWQTDKNAIMNFIEYVSGKNKNKNIDYSYNLSDASLFHLQMLLDEQLLDAKFSVKGRQDEMVDLQSKLDQIDSYLSVDIDEKVIAKIYKKLR